MVDEAILTENYFDWEVPVNGVLYRIAKFRPPANSYTVFRADLPIYMRLPVVTDATGDATTGAINVALPSTDFVESPYWDITQMIEVYAYNGTSWVKLAHGDGTSDGTWAYANGTVTAILAAAAGQPFKVYYIPARGYMRIDYEVQTPQGTARGKLFDGTLGRFVYSNLAKEAITLDKGVGIGKSDLLEIKVKATGKDPFNPFKPDNSGLVDILAVQIPVFMQSIA